MVKYNFIDRTKEILKDAAELVTPLYRQSKAIEFFIYDWRDKVYHLGEHSKYINPDGTATNYWEEIRKVILERDNYTCQRCSFQSYDILTVHHIIPRAEGGGDHPDNLIALCTKCHDEVELLGYRYAWQIMSLFDDEPIEDSRGVSDNWHGWVYGGARRPQENKGKRKKK